MKATCGNKECLDRLSYLPAIAGKFRYYEQLGLRVRAFLNLGIHERLDPIKLADVLGLKILSLDELNGLSESARAILSSSTAGWSGGASSELPDGSHIIFLNPSQSAGRQAATLMEEVCHILFGHKQSKIGLGEDHRNYNDSVEKEAYSVGAAALVPYRSLACDLSQGIPVKLIAQRFGVTQALVKYRMRVLRLTIPGSSEAGFADGFPT